MAATYAQLIADIQAFTAEDSGSELVSDIEEIVKRGQLRLLRDLDLGAFVDTDATVTNQTTRAITLPSGTIQCEEVWWDETGATAWNWAEERTYSRCREYAPDESTSGSVKYWNQDSESTLYLVPTPSAAIDLLLRVIKRPTLMSGSQSTNFLGDNFEDCLLWSCLVEAWQFLKDDERLQMAATHYAGLLPTAKKEADKIRRKTYKEVANMTENDNG